MKVHLKKPAAWTNIGSPKIHFWNTNNSNSPASTTWPGITMTSEGNGWYVYSFSAATQANIVFNNNSSPQSPDQTAITGGEKWCQMEGLAWKWYSSNPGQPVAGFDWRNATIYQVLIDRFANGSTANDNAYGRELDANGVAYPGFKDKQGTFHGGDLKGLTAKLQEGYFDSLGVAAIWITSPYEQVHGWIPGRVGNDQGFRFYSYHGYWPLDFTEVDANFGTYDDLVNFVDSAHAKGIRVILDVVLNHAGYYTLKDISEFNFGTLKSGWNIYYYNQPDSHITSPTYDNYIDVSSATAASWSRWWGKDWLRLSIDGGTPLPGYDPFGPRNLGEGQYGLPDFKTESPSAVSIPTLLNTKWSEAKKMQESNELNAFFTSTGRAATVRNHLIKWVTDWVVKLGIDGFRCDTAAHVELEAWESLKSAAQSRLSAWKAANPTKKIDDSSFWMVGEGSDINPEGPEFYHNGFDAMLKFSYRSDNRFSQALTAYPTINSLYAEYAASDKNTVSFISDHDFYLFNDGNTDRQKRGVTLLLLTPKTVNLLYGDENARTPGPSTWDEQQRIRSDMVFPGNADVLEHCKKVGQFRKKHLAVGAGAHAQIQAPPYTFSRILGNDKVICVLGASGTVNVPVAGVFANGTTVRDYYTGVTATVSNGSTTFTANANGVILIESL